jgi:hypothetical protein
MPKQFVIVTVAERKRLMMSHEGQGASPPRSRDRATSSCGSRRRRKIDALHMLVDDLVVARLQYEGIARRMAALRDEAVEASGVLRSLSTYASSLRGALPARVHAELGARVAAASSLVSDLSRAGLMRADPRPRLRGRAAPVGRSRAARRLGPAGPARAVALLARGEPRGIRRSARHAWPARRRRTHEGAARRGKICVKPSWFYRTHQVRLDEHT